MQILVLNAGSSSQKSCLYRVPDNELPSLPLEPLWTANIDWSVQPGRGQLTVKANGETCVVAFDSQNRLQSIAKMLQTLMTGNTKVIDHFDGINVVGHRVVHGGQDYARATLINTAVKQTIAKLIPLAPAHNPVHLEGIEAIENVLDNVPQVAVFDTAFHQTIPPKAAQYPIPQAWTEGGIRRYGFHGTSHKYCAQKAAELLQKPLESLNLITCHIGNGASLTAIQQGKSIDTTMGFTPLEGLMMGTRSGSIDPAILIFLQQTQGLTPEQLNTTLNKESGLQGVSGLSADLRTILTAKSDGNLQAQLAYDMYIHRFRACVGQMLASLGQLDTLVFTAGVGENAVTVREDVCAGFKFLGLCLDHTRNQHSQPDSLISSADSTVDVLIIHTQEDWAIATECWHLLKRS